MTFDRTFLPPALFEFVVIADTHYMLPPDGPVEFASRLAQTDRAATAIDLARALKPAFLIHLGDVTQEYPETPRFAQAFAQAKAALDALGAPVHHVPGNQDLGDKPDPTTPGLPVTEQTLARYHKTFGPSWYSFDHGPAHFVILNSQILNSTLPAAADQFAWLTRDLAQTDSHRIFLFLHLPLYLAQPSEPHLGHYDNIGQPARSRLLQTLRDHPVELIMHGHVHFAFFDRLASARRFIAASPAFTRPGFSHLFTSSAPPDQGRDDTPKLGFYLIRVLEDRADVHFIPTAGARRRSDILPPDRCLILTPPPAALPDCPLGLTLIHPITETRQIPLAWPSAVRQTVPNAYPQLACLHMGVKHLRLPLADLHDPIQLTALTNLRREGVRLRASVFAADETASLDQLTHARRHVDEIELLVFTDHPDPPTIDLLRRCQQAGLGPVCLSAVVARQPAPGKQHPRTRIGLLLEAAAQLPPSIQPDRILVYLPADRDPAHLINTLRRLAVRGPALDLRLALQQSDDRANAARIARALFAIASLPGARLYIEPLIDLDRTMDVAHGLLDTQCNPRPPFNVIRTLNALLFAAPTSWNLIAPDILENANRRLHLLTDPPPNPPADPLPTPARLYDLARATSQAITLGPSARLSDRLAAGPFILETASTSHGKST